MQEIGLEEEEKKRERGKDEDDNDGGQGGQDDEDGGQGGQAEDQDGGHDGQDEDEDRDVKVSEEEICEKKQRPEMKASRSKKPFYYMVLFSRPCLKNYYTYLLQFLQFLLKLVTWYF